jgi:murein DD-endopeptidase MepM/ murein hydrolase activator NlpD
VQEPGRHEFLSKHAGNRRPLSRSLIAVVGAVVVLGAGAGAAALGSAPQVPVSEPAMSAPQTRALRTQQAVQERRAQVMEASRSSQRTSLGADPADVRAAERGAAARARSLGRLEQAARERSEEIAAWRARQARLERQRELARQRALARQRRIERMNRWVVPVSDYEITATFGDGGGLWSSDHTGLDLAAPTGTPVGSAAEGEVASTEYDDDYGNMVIVTHDDGTQTWYCHMSSIAVSPGESVDPGSTVGYVGMTGNTTGPHLHLEVHPGGGAAVDPYTYLQERGAF